MVTRGSRFVVFPIMIVFILAAVASVSFGADKLQRPRSNLTELRARAFSPPMVNGEGHNSPAAPAEKVLFGSYTSRANPDEIGQTAYDYQHNCTMARQVEHRVGYTNTAAWPYGTYVHMDWMSQATANLGQSRNIGYQAWNLWQCDYAFPLGGNQYINIQYAGYCGMDAHNLDSANSWAVPMAHENISPYAPMAYTDYVPSGPVFGVFQGDYPTDRYGYYANPGVGDTNSNIWPKHDWDIDGADMVLHMVATEFTNPQTASYYRRVGPYGFDAQGNPLGVWSDQHVIDTVMNTNVTVTSSPISDKVAVVWIAVADNRRDSPGEFTADYSYIDGDVWFAIATDNGADWATHPTNQGNPSIGHEVDLGLGNGYNINVGGNLTTYDSTSEFRAYCDLSALWSIKDDPDDWLQIVWSGHYWNVDDPADLWAWRNRSAMYHWNQKFDEIKPVIKAPWIDTIDVPCLPNGWGGNVAKMTISECDGRLYICYSQFGSATNPCGTYDSQTNPDGWNMMAAQMYITVYDEQWRGWDRPQTVTGPLHPVGECTRPTNFQGDGGTCNSEYWASMARYGRVDECKLTPGTPALDILYINDLTPGGAIQPESGVWNLNPVRWMVSECRAAVPEPQFTVTPTAYGFCNDQPVLAVGTTDDTTVTMTMDNEGIIANDPVSIVANYLSGGSGQTNITVTPNSGISIPPAGGQQSVDLFIETTGEDESVIVNYDIVITQQAGENPPNDVHVPMCILVSDYYQSIESAVIATTCKRLRVYNNGQMSNNASNASLDFISDPDDCATVYLYDGSPMICREVGGNPVCYHSAFDNFYGTENTMRAVSPLFVDSTSHTEYTYATAEFLTGDSAIGMIVEYYAPRNDVPNCGYVIQKLKFWNKTEVTLTGVAAGEVLDWDVESHEHNSANFAGSDPTLNLIYQTCNGNSQHDPCDTLQNCDRYAGIAAATGVGTDQDSLGFKNYLVLENDVFVYTTSPPGFADNPFNADTTYSIMTGNTGYWWKNSPGGQPADTGEDLNTVVTFGVYDLVPNDTICVVKILTTSKNDANATQLKASVQTANDFIALHGEIQCSAGGCCDTAGDVNDDQAVNIGDAVYLINYIFKGGPPPPCLDEGDPNADCAINIGDAVYLINYIFKGGPPPECGCVPPIP